MKSLAALVFSALVFAAPVAADPIVEGDISPADLADVMKIAGTVDNVWNARRADEMAKLYSEDASLRFVSQDRGVSTRAGILDYFTKSFAQLTPDLRHVTTVDRIEVVSPTVVLADSSVALTSEEAGRETKVVRRFAVVNLLVKVGDAWQVRAVRTHLLPQDAAAVASR